MTVNTTSEHEVLFADFSGVHGDIGVITLNRPSAMNALNELMCIKIHEKLLEWGRAKEIKAVIVCGAGTRAFCAGGDIRSVYESQHQPEKSLQFFWHEYRLNHCIFHYPKPYLTLLDGLTMGGGAGISVNGAFRIATERFRFAMPETGIGFFPDVGGSYFLSRCPGKMGAYIGLTGEMLDAGDACYAGIANIYAPEMDLDTIKMAMIEAPWNDNVLMHETVKAVLKTFMIEAPSAQLSQRREIIEACFSEPTVEGMILKLNGQGDPWAETIAQRLLTRSPTSLKVTLAELQRASALHFDDCMRMEYQITQRFLRTPDFYEGIRATIIDKDRQPRWRPSTLAEVSEAEVAAFFDKTQAQLVFDTLC